MWSAKENMRVILKSTNQCGAVVVDEIFICRWLVQPFKVLPHTGMPFQDTVSTWKMNCKRRLWD